MFINLADYSSFMQYGQTEDIDFGGEGQGRSQAEAEEAAASSDSGLDFLFLKIHYQLSLCYHLLVLAHIMQITSHSTYHSVVVFHTG